MFWRYGVFKRNRDVLRAYWGIGLKGNVGRFRGVFYRIVVCGVFWRCIAGCSKSGAGRSKGDMGCKRCCGWRV